MAIRHYNRDNHRAGFIEWLKNNDVDTSAVSIAKFPDAGHGLRAERPIEVNIEFLKPLFVVTVVMVPCSSFFLKIK